MTKEEISKIKEHIEIHSKREPHAVKITEIMMKAVDELEHITELEKENELLKNKVRDFENQILGLLFKYESVYKRFPDLREAREKAELILNENAKLKERNGELAGQKASLERWFGEAKGIIKNIVRVTWGEGWNYSLDWKVKAENFLKEIGE